MRYARYRHGEDVAYGVIRDGRVHEVRGDIFADHEETGRSASLSAVELLVPVQPPNIFCVGRNYRDHIEEMGFEVPVRPALFMKPQGALLQAGETVTLPPRSISTCVQHEAELVVVIGRRTRDVAPERASDHIFGFSIANDISARDLQRSDSSVIRAKGFDGFCPLGPWIQTDIDPTDGLSVQCRVNGELRQDGSTSDLIFSVGELVSYLSNFATLYPGDLILTGSPGGTGDLEPGDEVEVAISGIGYLRHGVIEHASDRAGDSPAA